MSEKNTNTKPEHSSGSEVGCNDLLAQGGKIENYISECGLEMRREDGRLWFLRDKHGTLLGRDRYRNDLAERHQLKLLS